MMRARSEIERSSVEGWRAAPIQPVQVDHRYLAATTARSVAHANAAIIGALRNGAQSARSYDEDGLTYADGWAAAVTLATMVSYELLKDSG